MRRRSKILTRLLWAYLLPTLLLVALFGYLAHQVAKHSLDISLGQRLISIAEFTTTRLHAESLLSLSPGDDDSRVAKRLRQRLLELKQRTQVARLFALDPNLNSLCDTDPSIKIGDKTYSSEADRAELQAVFSGQSRSTVLFRGKDGTFYKTGYAPVFDETGKVIAAVGIDGSALFFNDLRALRNYLLLIGLLIAALIVLASVIVARRITQPVRALAHAADAIAQGKLDQPIPIEREDELGVLAKTMNTMREALYHREQEMQMMLSGIAHEVRNPLGGIALFTGLLREELAQQPTHLDYVKRVERELDSLKRIVEEFLAFARHHPLALSPTELKQKLHDAESILAADAHTAQVSLSVEGDPTWAQADPDQLHRVLLNVGRNAIQASETGGNVTFQCGIEEGKPFCRVIDRGVGIDERDLEKILRPFYTTKEKGTGLGLPLSKKIIDAHGGQLTIASQKGRGTTVTLWLQPADPVKE